MEESKKSYVCSGSFLIKNKKKVECCSHRKECFFYNSYKLYGGDEFTGDFHKVSEFRKCDKFKNSEHIKSTMLTCMIYGSLYVNDLACATIVDLSMYVKDKDKETKKIFGALDKRRKKYEREISEIVADKIVFLADFNDKMDEVVKVKYKRLKLAVRYMLHRHGYSDLDFLALVILSNMIIESSVEFIKKSVDNCCAYGVNAVNLNHYLLSDMMDVSNSFTKWCLRKVKNVNMNEENEVISSYQILIKTLSDWTLINDCIKKSL